MAPRANWKGFLKLSLVTCPVALFPATSETEKVSFNQINRKTGHRIKYTKVDAESGEDVPAEDIIKGYKVDTDTYVTIDKDELDNIALESTRTIDIDDSCRSPRSMNSILFDHITSCPTARSATMLTRLSGKPSAPWTRSRLPAWS